MTIHFKSESQIVEVVTPQGDLARYEVEYRWDPLISHVAIICPHLKAKWKGFYSNRDEEWLHKTTEGSKEKCPFCKSMIDVIAARFPQTQMEEEILKFKNIYVFPNLFPRTSFEAVVTSPGIHSPSFRTIDKHMTYDFLDASIKCIQKAYKKNDTLLYPIIGCNYLPPAGASLIHFHMQISMQIFPFVSIKNLIDNSTHYAETNSTNYWLDLIDANKCREIAHKNNLYWYTPFAPAGFADVRAIIKQPNILSFTEQDIGDLADGLAALLRYYNNQGFSAFNFIIFSGSLDTSNKEFFSGFHIIARPNLRSDYLSIDSWYMPLLLGQPIVLESPEEVAQNLRTYFN